MITRLALAAMLFMALSMQIKADVLLNATNFPDANFRAFLATELGIAQGGNITTAKINAKTTMDCSSKNIASLVGIQNFTALTSLSCQNNQLTTMDISFNKALTYFDCSNNKLTSLDLTSNTKLTSLSCNTNKLTVISLSTNVALTYVNCGSNQITALPLTQNIKIATLLCTGNQLGALDLSNNKLITTLKCRRNNIAALDLSSNKALLTLDCGVNKLSNLDLTANTAITSLVCDSCKLTKLNLTPNKSLKLLYCNYNYINSLVLSSNTALADFELSPNGRIIKVKKAENANHPASSFYYIPVSEIAGKTGVNTGTTLVADGFDVTKCSNWVGASLYTTLAGDIDGVAAGTQILKLSSAALSPINSGYKRFSYTYNTDNSSCPGEFYLDWKDGDADITTIVSNVADDTIKIYAAGGCIHVEGTMQVEVFGINGARIYHGNDNEIHVALGIYIVRISNGKSYKVAVK